jgi:hypothetical protein
VVLGARAFDYGQDLIQYSYDTTAGKLSTFLFKAGVAPSEVQLRKVYDTAFGGATGALEISIAGTTDKVAVMDSSTATIPSTHTTASSRSSLPAESPGTSRPSFRRLPEHRPQAHRRPELRPSAVPLKEPKASGRDGCPEPSNRIPCTWGSASRA